MAKNKKINKEPKGKLDHWPKREKLDEALEVFERFRELCKFQMELGYWATIDFPTKHHLNKILSVQYMEKALLKQVYGKVLANRVLKMVPYCKNYISFVREEKNGKRQNSGHTAKASSKK